MPLLKASDMGAEFVLHESWSDEPITEKFAFDDAQSLRGKVFMLHRLMTMEPDGWTGGLNGRWIVEERTYLLSDIGASDSNQIMQLMQRENEAALSRAIEALKLARKHRRRLPGSIEYRRRVAFLENVVSVFEMWFDKMKIALPETYRQVAGLEETDRLDDGRKVWRQGKGDFAIFVVDHYGENKHRYMNRAHAARVLYEAHRFPFAWTLERCQALVRQQGRLKK